MTDRGLLGEGALSAAHVRLAASGLGIAERPVWRWLDDRIPERPVGRPRYRLSDADRAAFADFRGNVTAVFRARCAVLDGGREVAGVAVPEHLVTGWAEAEPVALRTLQLAFARELTPAERAAWTDALLPDVGVEMRARAAPRGGPIRAVCRGSNRTVG